MFYAKNIDRLVLWVSVVEDPNPELRGFSLLGRSFRPIYMVPVDREMYSIIDKNVLKRRCYVIGHKEWIRVVPEFSGSIKQDEWLIPAELCMPRVTIQDVAINPIEYVNGSGIL